MDSYFFIIPLVVVICLIAVSCNKQDEDKIDYLEIAPSRYLYKINFEGHSYIFLRNTWNSSGDKLLHDPDCECLKDK